MSPPAANDPFAAVSTDTRDLNGRTGRWLFAAAAVFGLWAVLVPLDSAVVVSGTLMSEGRNMVLQHLAGGRIAAIFAKEGDLVRAGETILELEPLVDQARLTKLRARKATLEAIETRLQAEKALDRAASTPGPGPVLPVSATLAELRLAPAGALNDAGDPAPDLTGIEALLRREQEREFSRGRRAVSAQLTALRNRAEAERRREEGLVDQSGDAERQLELLGAQLDNARLLAKAGHLPRREVWELEARVLQQQSLLTKLTSDASASERAIAEIEAEMERVRMEDARKNSEALTDTLSELEEIRDELAAAETTLRQTAITAPVDGHLVHFSANTPGGVVAAGKTVGEIVPTGARLVARGRVGLHDIAQVRAGQSAEIRVSSLPARTDEPIPATVTFVASDSTEDERTGEHFFEVEAELDLTGREATRARLSAGMGAEMFIKGDARTFARYLAQPLTDALSRSFREH